jgi:hypothetical protein
MKVYQRDDAVPNLASGTYLKLTLTQALLLRAAAPVLELLQEGPLSPGPADGLTKREGAIVPADQASRVAGFLQPSRDVTLPVQHAPNVDVIGVLDVEHQMGIPRQRPGSKARQVQLVGEAR